MTRKAQLLNQQQVNVKKLFHGTSPENVEAICERKFDPRLHSRNKSVTKGFLCGTARLRTDIN